MENPCTLLLFGDSITKDYSPHLEKALRSNYPEIDLTVINNGVSGETSRDALTRLEQSVSKKPDVVVIGFGMNDWRKGVDTKEYKKNLTQMIVTFESAGARVVLNTVSPSYNFKQRKYNNETTQYSKIVRELAYEKRVKIADIETVWNREMKKPKDGLGDELHPNILGYEIIVKSLMWIVTRKYTTVLWQYNGREAKCNYRCPYCYYIGLHNASDRFTGYIDQWHERFLEAFGKQNLIFYLAFGEPTIGAQFPDVLNMIGNQHNWQLRITSNISHNLSTIYKSKAAREGRLNVNASYHPSMTKRDDFFKNLQLLRKNGIEPSIVYVAYPPFLDHFFDDIRFFSENGFVVHVRRFQGYYKKELYPWAYTDKQKRDIAGYSDDGMIKYMLNQHISKGGLTFSGLHFFAVDNAGNIGYDANAFRPYTALRNIFGNIHTGNFRPNLVPSEYPGYAEGTVDGVANIVSANYKQLENNNVIHFASQGGVYKDSDGKVIYSNEEKDFTNPRIRAEYNFAPQKLKDYLVYFGGSGSAFKQAIFQKVYLQARTVANRNKLLLNIAKKIVKS
jgi:acyl-CoA thioesterase-1